MRLVAPITTTCPRESRPSMRASSVLTMLLWIWSCLLLLTCTPSASPSHLLLLYCLWRPQSHTWPMLANTGVVLLVIVANALQLGAPIAEKRSGQPVTSLSVVGHDENDQFQAHTDNDPGRFPTL